jgi:hypothetical protein
MDFTFGIITSAKTNGFIPQIIKSIEDQGIPNYEIIIVGTCSVNSKASRVIPFDESDWITKKKNIIFQEAKYENVVVFHDYILLERGWYEGFLKFGNNFQVCINPIKNLDGSRFRDYVLFNNYLPSHLLHKTLLPYSSVLTPEISKISYISGSYYVVKKSVALKIPLREELYWNQGEDVIFSQDLADNNILIECNPYSSVKFLKNKYRHPFENEMTDEDYTRLKLWAHINAAQVFNQQKAMQHKWLRESHGIKLVV